MTIFFLLVKSVLKYITGQDSMTRWITMIKGLSSMCPPEEFSQSWHGSSSWILRCGTNTSKTPRVYMVLYVISPTTQRSLHRITPWKKGREYTKWMHTKKYCKTAALITWETMILHFFLIQKNKSILNGSIPLTTLKRMIVHFFLTPKINLFCELWDNKSQEKLRGPLNNG